MVLTLNFYILTFYLHILEFIRFPSVFVLYCVFANPAFGCHIPINVDDDDAKYICSSKCQWWT